MKNIDTEIIIAGGGVPALSLALILSKSNIKTIIIDPFEPQEPEDIEIDGRTVALWNSSIDVLKRSSIWDSINKYACKLEKMQVIDDSKFPNKDLLSVEFPASELDLDCFGYNIPNKMLLSYAAQTAKNDDNITLLYGCSVENIDFNDHDVEINLSNNKTLKAKLIIGADGRNSRVRESANIDFKQHDYGQSAITCLINHSKDHNFTSTEFHRNGGPFTVVPFSEKVSSIVWMEKNEDADKFIKMRKDELTKALQERTRGLVGTIDLKTNPQLFPIIALKANSVIAKRTALIAEAAHVISPIGAQGMNLSLRDVADLADVIIQNANLGLDIGSTAVLDKYKKSRKRDIGSRFSMVDGLNKIVSNSFESVRGIRRFGLKAISLLPPLKRTIMKEGLCP